METIIKINVLEVASELAHEKLVNNWEESIKIYVNENADELRYTEEAQDIFRYTEEAQDIFAEYYDEYLNFLYAHKEK
jgi:hypothetical protein